MFRSPLSCLTLRSMVGPIPCVAPAVRWLTTRGHAVRLVEDTADAPLLKTKPAFIVEGAPNVFLETVKRGLDDDFKSHESPSVVLRLYEAFGGHGQVRLRFAPNLSVVKVALTNLLEDELEELSVYQAEDNSSIVKLSFHGFEVKTVKLTLGKQRYFCRGDACERCADQLV